MPSFRLRWSKCYIALRDPLNGTSVIAIAIQNMVNIANYGNDVSKDEIKGVKGTLTVTKTYDNS